MMKLRDLMAGIRERKRQLLIVMMMVFASFGGVHAIDNDSTLYALYTMIIDFADIAPAIVTLVLAFVVLIFVGIIVSFLRNMFESIVNSMGTRRRGR